MDDVPHYDKLRDTLLDCCGLTEDHFRLRFFSICYTANQRLWTLVGELRDTAIWWLKPEMAEGHWIVEKTVLYQVYQVMPTEARIWVTRHHPSKLQEAICLWKTFLDTEPTAQ